MPAKSKRHASRATPVSEPEREELWVALAYVMRRGRTGRGRMSYQAIADALDRPYRQVYVALNRDKVRHWDSESDKRHREERTTATLKRRREVAPRCERCGHPMHDSRVKGTVCRRCQQRAARLLEEQVAQLWRAGVRPGDIDVDLDLPGGSAAAIAARLRKRGVDLPLRKRYRGLPLDRERSDRTPDPKE